MEPIVKEKQLGESSWHNSQMPVYMHPLLIRGGGLENAYLQF